MEIRTIGNAMPQAGIRPLADSGQVLQPVANVEAVTVKAVTPPSRAETASASEKAAGREGKAHRTDGKEESSMQEGAGTASLAEAKEKIAASLESFSRASGLQFAIDDELGRVVVKVIDPETDSVLKQFPSEDALQLAKSLESFGGGLVKEKA